MAQRRSSSKSEMSAQSTGDPIAERKSKRLGTANKEDMLIEMDSLEEELEVAHARLRCATEEVQQLKKQLSAEDEGIFCNRSTMAHRTAQKQSLGGFGDLSTEAEVRWGFLIAEKMRLQREKGYQKALKESKKMLLEQLDEAQLQSKARDMEMTNIKIQLGDRTKELEKTQKLGNELKVMVADLQATLDSEHHVLAQANERNCQLQEELSALFHTKESDLMKFERGERRMVTHDLRSQLVVHEDSEDMEGSESLRQSVQSGSQWNDDHASQSRRSSIQQQQEGLHHSLCASEAARRKLEAQVAELQHRLGQAEHQAEHRVPSTQSQQETALKRSEGDETCEQCKVLRDELANVLQAKEWEARESEDQRRQLEAQVSAMQRQAQLAEKELRAWQGRVSAPWWSRIACNCSEKRYNQADQQPKAVAPDSEKNPQSVRPPRAAIHMQPAKNVGASWLARPMG